jgi:hypothetical protein
MVRAVRKGASMREVAARFGVSVGTVVNWVRQAHGKRLDRVNFTNCKPGRPWNRTPEEVEQRILSARMSLREESVLGEYGPDAIGLALRQDEALAQVPGRTTIYRVLARHGLLDAAHRQRRPAPPKGWYLPDLAAGRAELDSFDFIEDLKIADGPLVSALTGTSLHGALADVWIIAQARAAITVDALIERWRRDGLPDYAQFDNDPVFQGGHRFADSVGRVSRLCLALGIIVVFAPPREPGFQNAIEGFNGLWQSKVWQRHRFPDVATLKSVSARYIAAYRAKTAGRCEAAPSRRAFPHGFRLDLNTPLKGTLIFLRRSNDAGAVLLLGTAFPVDKHWVHRLVRCEVNFTHRRIRFYALRRRDPNDQPLLRELPYRRPDKPFHGTP